MCDFFTAILMLSQSSSILSQLMDNRTMKLVDLWLYAYQFKDTRFKSCNVPENIFIQNLNAYSMQANTMQIDHL